MADWSTAPFRADHVGSLLRPKALTEAFKAHRAGAIGDAAFAAAQDQAIRQAVALQEAAGLKSITDGEFRRPSYWARFVERVAGLEVREALFRFHDEHGHEQAFTAPHVAGPVSRPQAIAVDELEFLRTATRQCAKITLPSPPTMHFWRLEEGISPGVYGDRQAFFADLARVYRAELADLAAHGGTYVQLDEVPLAMLCDPAVRAHVQALGSDPAALIGDYVALFNACLAGRPAGLSVALHLCRGNFKAQFLSEGGYDEIAARLFNEIDVDAFFLEYDSPRAGDFAPLSQVPAEKRVILGLISTKTPELETADRLLARIEAAGRELDADQLGLSPQCGFASTAGGNPVSLADQQAKLALTVTVANRFWS